MQSCTARGIDIGRGVLGTPAFLPVGQNRHHHTVMHTPPVCWMPRHSGQPEVMKNGEILTSKAEDIAQQV